jgi:hypothetical protein
MERQGKINDPGTSALLVRIQLSPPSEGGDKGVVLKIYDMRGREVATLINQQLNPGTYEVAWSATGGASNYPSGVYFYRLTVGDYSLEKKMVLIK